MVYGKERIKSWVCKKLNDAITRKSEAIQVFLVHESISRWDDPYVNNTIHRPVA